MPGSGKTQRALQPCRMRQSMPDHNYFANLIWQIADLLRGPYRPPQYERVMLPMTVLRRFDFVKLKGDPDHITEHLVSYINGFSANVRAIFDFFEFEGEIEKMREANILY